jgi:hypothetical protein
MAQPRKPAAPARECAALNNCRAGRERRRFAPPLLATAKIFASISNIHGTRWVTGSAVFSAKHIDQLGELFVFVEGFRTFRSLAPPTFRPHNGVEVKRSSGPLDRSK